MALKTLYKHLKYFSPLIVRHADPLYNIRSKALPSSLVQKGLLKCKVISLREVQSWTWEQRLGQQGGVSLLGNV